MCMHGCLSATAPACWREGGGQSRALCSRSEALISGGTHAWALRDPRQQCEASEGCLCRRKRLELQHRTHDPLDCPVVLLHHMLEILPLADHAGGTLAAGGVDHVAYDSCTGRRARPRPCRLRTWRAREKAMGMSSP